jgi:hypothetical protein
MFSSCTSYAAAATLKHYSAIEILDSRLIQDFLGHRNIQHTVKYTATNPPALVALNRKQWAIPGNEKVCFRRKRSTYHNVVVGIGCDTGCWGRTHQSCEFRIKVNQLVN